jgi:hypothetical protein
MSDGFREGEERVQIFRVFCGLGFCVVLRIVNNCLTPPLFCVIDSYL